MLLCANCSLYKLLCWLTGCPLCACCSAAAPKSRLPYICTPQLPWSQVAVYEVGQQGALVGPVVVSDSSKEDVARLPSLGYSHLVYVCTK
jgi:hypothetical protein